MNRNLTTLMSCDNEYEESSIVIYGAPFDSTTSFKPGTRFASQAMRPDSYGLETYSTYQDKDMEDYCYFDAGDLEFPFGNAQRTLKIIEDFSDEVLADGKMPVMIGGEHLVTLGAIRSVAKKYEDLHIIHFDAHADLRDDYMGEKLSHASVMKRCWEIVGDDKIYQFGIRSGSKEEIYWGKEHVYTRKFDAETLSEIAENLKGKNVYVTIDLDVLDPSIFPGTGTPEAGGITFREMIAGIKAMKDLNIVAFDINELSPHYDQSGVSTAVACKVLREMLLLVSK
ncbi:agmatinase [uncultured Clostridium sp.]|jgi:agmatinase|uniref:agmatinase n=1 Tax=uncultured Clostridium sp. TaxID=59620 RepID=UPI00262E3ABA|nr:agmatinase [uncultured Clostridium sp.]